MRTLPVIFLLIALPAHAAEIADRPNQVRGDEIAPAQQQAVDLGLRYLASRQQADGSYGGYGSAGGHASITALGRSSNGD